MVNNVDFIKRLEKILEEYELSAAAFAQKIAVGRASISHILSGRNKPSLDFVLKITSAFPEVDLYWLLLGQGQFSKNNTTLSPTSSIQEKKEELPDTSSKTFSRDLLPRDTPKGKSIRKIVIFYDDQSFESFDN